MASENPSPVADGATASFATKAMAWLRERPLLAALLAATLILIIVYMPKGCDDGRVPVFPVTGRVLFPDGTPVRTGTIEFESTEYGTSSTGRINDDGSFVLGTYESEDGAPAGEHRVIVMQLVISDGTVRHEKDHGKPVDPRFASFESSGLKATVANSRANELRIEVQSPRE